MDPRILENWYFTIWAYNGFSSSNNPNVRSKPYQLKVIERAKQIYGQDITPIDKKLLPSSGRPDSKGRFKTPEPYHLVDFVGAKKGNIKIDKSYDYTGRKSELMDSAVDGKKILELEPNCLIEILEEPIVTEGKLMYKIKVIDNKNENDSGKVGWVQLKKVSDIRQCDIDGSGEIDIIDVYDVLSAIYSNKEYISKFDVNYDNIVNINDAKLIDSQCDLKLIDIDKISKDSFNVINEVEAVDASKQWTITFNKPLSGEDTQNGSIIVLDSKGDFANIETKLSDNGKDIVVTPLESYKSGEKYYLIIQDKITSQEQDNLNQLTILKFYVK